MQGASKPIPIPASPKGHVSSPPALSSSSPLSSLSLSPHPPSFQSPRSRARDSQINPSKYPPSDSYRIHKLPRHTDKNPDHREAVTVTQVHGFDGGYDTPPTCLHTSIHECVPSASSSWCVRRNVLNARVRKVLEWAGIRREWDVDESVIDALWRMAARIALLETRLGEDIDEECIRETDAVAVPNPIKEAADDLRPTSVIARDTLDAMTPEADALGVWCFKARMEDAAFRALHPEAYAKIRRWAMDRRDRENLEITIREITAVLEKSGEEEAPAVKIHDVSARPKSAYGIWCKIGKKDGHALRREDVDGVLDISAVRVVVDTRAQCYSAMRAMHCAFSAVPGRFKDMIKRERKANGYRSLHDTLLLPFPTHKRELSGGFFPVEVQVRSHKMHYVAEFGTAAHWIYKADTTSSSISKICDKSEQQRCAAADVSANQKRKDTAFWRWRAAYEIGVLDVEKVRREGQNVDRSLAPLGWLAPHALPAPYDNRYDQSPLSDPGDPSDLNSCRRRDDRTRERLRFPPPCTGKYEFVPWQNLPSVHSVHSMRAFDRDMTQG